MGKKVVGKNEALESIMQSRIDIYEENKNEFTEHDRFVLKYALDLYAERLLKNLKLGKN